MYLWIGLVVDSDLRVLGEGLRVADASAMPSNRAMRGEIAIELHKPSDALSQMNAIRPRSANVLL